MSVGVLFRRTGAGLLVFAAVWAASVYYWRRTGAQPGPGELVVLLLAMPVGLLGGYWLLRWGIDRRRAAAGSPQVASPAHGGDAADSGPVADRILALLAGAVLLPAGASADEAAAALVEPKRPGLHPSLRDSAGMPVFAAPVEGIETDAIADALQAVLNGDEALEALFEPEQLRAVALLDPVADELLYLALPPETEVADPYALAYSPSQRDVTAESVLRVRLLLPAAWPLAARQAVADWLLAKARAMGFRDDAIAVQALPLTTAHDVWRLLDQLAQSQSHPFDADRHLLLAGHSGLGDATIDRLDQHGALLAGNRPEGVIPGEGAAGVLLATSTAVPAPATADAPADAPADASELPVRLHRGGHAAALHGVPSRRVVSHAGALIERALATAAQPAAAIGTVLSDADHRPSRAIEIAGAVSAVFPDLDPVAQCLGLGLACGDLGPVGPLALLATAAARVRQSGAPVLAMSLADPDHRVAFALSPTPVAAAGPTSAPTPEPTADLAAA